MYNYNDLEISLLSLTDIISDSNTKNLGAIEKYGPLAAKTDLYLLTNGFYYPTSISKVPDDNTARGGTCEYYTKTGGKARDDYGYYRDGAVTIGINGRNNAVLFFEKHKGIRPVISSPSVISNLKDKMSLGYNGVLELEFGYYPQYAASIEMQEILDHEYSVGYLVKTGIDYVFNDVSYDSGKWNLSSYPEFEYKGKKYINIKARCYNEVTLSNNQKYKDGDTVWVEVSPVVWLYDEKTNVLISKKCLLSGIEYNDHDGNSWEYNDGIKWYLNRYMLKNITLHSSVESLLTNYGLGTLNNTSEDICYYTFFSLFIKKFKDIPNKRFVETTSLVNKMIVNDDIPPHIMHFITTIEDFKFCFSSKAYNKLLEYKDYEDEEHIKNVPRFFKSKDNTKFNNIGKYIESIKFGSPISLKCNNIDEIIDMSNYGEIEYGEYPVKKASLVDGALLDAMYYNGLLNKTNKKYKDHILFNRINMVDEYSINNRKFIRLNKEWIEVLPLKWAINKKKNALELKYKIDYLNKLKNDKQMDSFYEEAIVNYEKSNENKVDNTINQEIKKISRKISEKKAIDELENIKRQDDNNKAEFEKNKAQLEIAILEKFELLKKLDEVNKKLEELNITESNAKIKRINVGIDILIKKVDNHLEFNKSFIPYLKYINLSSVKTKNLKISGIDFRETNLYVYDPKYVYNMDLSGSSFDDTAFILKDFSGCDLRGTDLSRESDCSGYENAIIDENTKLPKGEEKTL